MTPYEIKEKAEKIFLSEEIDHRELARLVYWLAVCVQEQSQFLEQIMSRKSNG